MGGFASPPCSTVSRARHIPLKDGRQGPRPLRSRDNMWEPLPERTAREQLAVAIGSCLYLLCLGLLGEVRMQGGWIGLEHPADPGHPYLSFFVTCEVETFRSMFRLMYYEVHQCVYGAVSKKPTGLLLPSQCKPIDAKCQHGRKHRSLIGLDSQGRFHTTPAAKYPPPFCEAPGENFVSYLAQFVREDTPGLSGHFRHVTPL